MRLACATDTLWGAGDAHIAALGASGTLYTMEETCCGKVGHFCACIGSPCLRQCVHGASIASRAGRRVRWRAETARRGRATGPGSHAAASRTSRVLRRQAAWLTWRAIVIGDASPRQGGHSLTWLRRLGRAGRWHRWPTWTVARRTPWLVREAVAASHSR
jgi:hypothetical protein